MAVPHHVLIEIGSRWSSSLVLAEAEVSLHHWREDVTALAPFGWGERRRARFESLVDLLRARHDARGRELAAPSAAAAATERARARRWFDRAVSILEAAELDAPEAAAAAAALPPPGDGSATLRDAVHAALVACEAHRDVLDREAADAVFYAEGAALEGRLTAHLEPVALDALDREELIDTLDGEVYLTLRGLHRAAHRAFADDAARAARYTFQFLVTIQRGEEPVPARRSEPPRRSDAPRRHD